MTMAAQSLHAMSRRRPSAQRLSAALLGLGAVLAAGGHLGLPCVP